MKRNLIFGLLVFPLVALLLLGACAEPAAEPTTSAPATTTPAPAATAPSEVIELNFATGLPPVAHQPQLQQSWLQKVEEMSEGRLKLNFHAGGSLLEAPEMFRGVQGGIADIGWYTVGEGPGLFEISQLALLPFLGWKSMTQAGTIYHDLTSEDTPLPQFRDEFLNAEVVPYCCAMMPPMQLVTTTKEVRDPEDISGMKLYALGDIVEIISQAGAAPVEMGPEEFYMSLERGVIDGMFLHYGAIGDLGLTELVKYNMIFGESGCYMSPISYIFNAESWNSLPPDLQQLFKDTEPWLFEETNRIQNEDVARAMNNARDLGQTFIELTPEEIEPWAALANPIHEARIEKLEAEGVPAKELYDGLMKMIAEYPAE